ncbi:MAG: hypothetical protein HQK49_02900 [Oligoflexia bacterium]|nr:hypothetical protein [Oligoflexia bacterium]
MERKIEKCFEDFGFGFKVKIINAPMIKIRGEWVLDINFKKLQLFLLLALAQKPARLTGNEIQFIRKYFQMTASIFGKKFDVSHAAVLKWEKTKNHNTGMTWSTEKDIRLFIISKIQPKPTYFLSVYNGLENKASNTKAIPLELDGKKVA